MGFISGFKGLNVGQVWGFSQLSILALRCTLIWHRTDCKLMSQRPSEYGWLCTSMKDARLKATVIFSNQN